MADYPKEVLDAFERDLGIRIKGRGGIDSRLCYGATCTWFGPIHETKNMGIPGCPLCGGVLFEMDSEQQWWDGVDKYESDGHPGYRSMWEWQRDAKKCFPLNKGLGALAFAYNHATGRHVKYD